VATKIKPIILDLEESLIQKIMFPGEYFCWDTGGMITTASRALARKVRIVKEQMCYPLPSWIDATKVKPADPTIRRIHNYWCTGNYHFLLRVLSNGDTYRKVHS